MNEEPRCAWCERPVAAPDMVFRHDTTGTGYHFHYRCWDAMCDWMFANTEVRDDDKDALA